jgi:L-threonylcarbamoyladenylate synthase
MKIINIDLENFSKEGVEVVAGEILKGEVVVLPTDTVYGLSAIVTSKKAIRKIYKIKKRTPKQQKHLLLLVKSFCMVRRYCFLTIKQHRYLKERWVEGNRALTVILRGRRDYFRERNINLFELISDDDGVAVRRPDNKFLLELIKIVGEPIVSTSLNIAGEAELKDVSRVDKYFKEAKPDVIVDVGELPKRKPSRLEDLRDMNDIKIYRE